MRPSRRAKFLIKIRTENVIVVNFVPNDRNYFEAVNAGEQRMILAGFSPQYKS